MKALSALFYLIAAILTAIGIYNLLALPHEFGGEAYTSIVSLGYAQSYLLLALISFFLGFVFAYNLYKNPVETEVEEIKEVKEMEDTNTYDYLDEKGNIRNVTPKTAKAAGWTSAIAHTKEELIQQQKEKGL